MSVEIDLPSLDPLSHSNPYLTSSNATFDRDAFLLSRAQHSSLPELRSDLREYLATLKAELVQLINDDYESFISLSTDLRGEGTRLERIKAPLSNIREQIIASRDELQVIQDNVQSRLSDRASLREQKALLHLLLKLSESVSRLESLLYIKSPGDDAPSLAITTQDRGTTSKVKHLSRVAAEYAQLVYLAQKASAENCAFVDALHPRITTVKNTLTTDISSFFASTLVLKPPSERERTKQISDINECLKIYDALGLQKEAEEVMRREVVRPFVKKAIFPNALTVPPSPIVPHTPLELQRTLSTPTTSLAPSFPFPIPNHDRDHTHIPQIDESTPLGAFFNTLLRFIEREFKNILLMSERLNASKPKVKKEGEEEGEEGYEVLANVVWDELGRAIGDELGSVIFVIGRPGELQKNHAITTAFLNTLESLAPSPRSLTALRAHPVYVAFEKRWQLGVYFQLRWKEIVGKLEDVLISGGGVKQGIERDKEFITPQAAGTYRAIERCWAQDVYIPELGWRFWRLTLQILVRYSTWLEKTLPQSEKSTTRDTGGPGHDIAQENMTLKQAAGVIADISALKRKVEWIWAEQISVLLPEVEEGPTLKEILSTSLLTLSSPTVPLSNSITSILLRRATEALTPVRQIPSQYRATKRAPPTKASEYVSGVMKPVKVFFGVGGVIGEEHAVGGRLVGYKEDWSGVVFEGVVAKFISLLTIMRKNEESLRRLKKGGGGGSRPKSAFSLFSSSSVASSDDGVDEDRVRAQVVLDVEALGRDAEGLGVRVGESEAFAALRELAAARYDDGT